MLGCIQPISSPMMKRMLGFCCCCAAAGTLIVVIKVISASGPSQGFRVMFMTFSLVLPGTRRQGGERGSGAVAVVTSVASRRRVAIQRILMVDPHSVFGPK